MVFSSVIFLCIFLPAVLLGYYILPRKARNIWLLVASLAFYACSGPKHLIYLLSSILINYFFGLVISKMPSGSGKGSGAALVMFILGAAGIILCLVTGRRLKRYRYTEE